VPAAHAHVPEVAVWSHEHAAPAELLLPGAVPLSVSAPSLTSRCTLCCVIHWLFTYLLPPAIHLASDRLSTETEQFLAHWLRQHNQQQHHHGSSNL
jgi:hypothetical protein